ncbi:MAG TPA: MCP four helix bundle domain-containing protein [Dysgonamonadaceae bacterium]|nr:MCP four helix bundle domain-containing protein [Dysgonamonadaceae bacterium]HUI32854.1 MCP four helix bundle domain-containing protein [Dysgonamonadaceae bacterium]
MKVKIFSSFMLLVFMLLIAGLMSIWELRNMNNSFSDVIDNNYQSIEHALKVIYALEREDSGILMVYLGDGSKGLSVIHAADSTIQKSMIEIKKNATEKGEEGVIKNIESEYRTYSALLDSAILNKTGTNEMVYKTLHNQFIKTKTEVNFLMELNQTSMYSKATEMHNRLYQTMMPGIVSIILAIIFALLLNFFISRYFVTPLHKLIDATKNYKPPLTNLNVTINSEDELKTLKIEIDNLIRRVLSYCKSE